MLRKLLFTGMASLLALSPEAVAQQQPAAAGSATAAAAYTPMIECHQYRLSEGTKITIRFGVPMIPAEEVGSTVKPGYYTASIPDCSTAVWESTSSIRVEITKDLPPMHMLFIAVPEGLRGLNGESISAANKGIPTYKGYLIRTTYLENGDVLVQPNQPDFADMVRDRLSLIYYLNNKNSDVLKYHEATVGEMRKIAQDRPYLFPDALKNKQDNEIAPNMWIVESPGEPTGGSTLRMVMPASAWNYRDECYTAHHFAVKSTQEPSYSLHKLYHKRGDYSLTLNFRMPAANVNAAALVKQLHWSISSRTNPKKRIRLNWNNGVLRAGVEGKRITITPTEVKKKDIKLLGGKVVTGVTSLQLKADTSEAEVELYCEGVYTPVAPTAPNKRPRVAETSLQPPDPFIYTDVIANHMQLVGSTTLRCRYGYLRSGQARMWKLQCTPAETVRLLQDYRLRYNGGGYMHDGSYSYYGRGKKAHEQAGLKENELKDNKVDTATLPGVTAKAERPLSDAPDAICQFPLAELFPGQSPGGLYFVEMEGIPQLSSKTPFINQGVVQVTDLGLLWKTNGRSIFARAYSLSTGKEVPVGTLRFFDKAGNQLAEIAVKDGLAEGDFPKGTDYLQLSTESDSLILPHQAKDVAQWTSNSWENSQFMDNGICPADMATPLVYLFSDRNLYRPGETAHIKGIARRVHNNTLQTPKIERITATITRNGKRLATQEVKPEEDGTFAMDFTMQEVGHHNICFAVDYKEELPPALKAVLEANPDAAELVEREREFSISLECKEFRRNEFEVSSEMNVQQDERRVNISATATNLTGIPLADGLVRWHLLAEKSNFYPQQPEWRKFRFGDFRHNPWDHFYAYSLGRYERATDFMAQQEGKLDAQGKGHITFSLPEQTFPRTRSLVASTVVTNGNEQSIRSVQKATLHPAEIYAGICAQHSIAKVDSKLPVELVAVKSDGTAWDGAPLPATVKVTRTVFRPYRYGAGNTSSVRNSEESNNEQSFQVHLTGKPEKLEIPLGRAGQYDVEVSGKDTKGRTFCSATRHYVWGDDVSPWRHMNHHELELVPDKPQYMPGETARILVQTPVDAELLFTVERDRVLRHYRRSVTVDNPMVEIPIEAGDAPVVYLAVSLVQSDDRRNESGKPQVKLGVCTLKVATPDKILTVRTEAALPKVKPGASCTVSGIITDAAGNPVPHADVTLYAVDEGTLQVIGYQLPDPAAYFYSERGREHLVNNYSGLRYLVSENLKNRFLGNKGVFIGGGDGDDAMAAGMDDAGAAYLRENFNPCAVWLAGLRTDAEGRFQATYNNPDTLTRYRLMAVASAGDKFGAGESSYLVTKPVMLEPIAPMSATEGDELMLPVTVSMQPADLPAGCPDTITWNVSLSGQNVDIPAPTQSVTLHGNKPTTLHFPVKVLKAAPTRLQWRVQAADVAPDAPLAAVTDAVQLNFEAVPPTPYLRESLRAEIKDGQSASLKDWLKTAYQAGGKVQLTLSTSPLAGIAYPLDYLFRYPYGCTEQLSSAVIPWVLREDLQKALGLEFPSDRNAEEMMASVKSKLMSRRLTPGYYSYWAGHRVACQYSPHAVLALHLMGEDMTEDFKALSRDVQEYKGNPYLSLVTLAYCGKATALDLESVLNRDGVLKRDAGGTGMTSEQMWALAYAAHVLQHATADELLKRAENCSNTAGAYHAPLPPVEAMRSLIAIRRHAQAPDTTENLRRYLEKSAAGYSTWRNNWMVLAVHAYTQKVDLSQLRATINGKEVSTPTPIHLTTTTDSAESWSVSGDSIYVSGFAEGHVVDEQPTMVIDKGFYVQRTYQRVLPDGSLQPTGTFQVGDVVLVTVSAKPTTKHAPLRYFAMEDRLPAAFEAVDPELISQALPQGMNPERVAQLYFFTGCLNHREFLKDRVRAFASGIWGTQGVEMRYVARVVRSGKVTAPAAKAELMYQPEVHGLSIPQHFDVKPR